jgi:hypothetical protein
MGWKTRGGRRYYYRSIRQGGRVVSEYVGAGEDVGLIAALETAERDKREAAAADWRAERARLVAEGRTQAERFDQVEILVRLLLEAAGFHRHNRGEWRRRRMSDQTETPTPVQALPSPASPTPARPRPTTEEELRDVLKRAGKGDRTALPRLRELFDLNPEGMVAACHGDLARVSEDVAVDRMTGKDLTFAEAMRRKMAMLRDELTGPDPSPMERLLVERVVLCWLDCHDWEIRHNAAMQSEGGLSFRQAEHYQAMRDRAHRRYLQALKTLASVRKMGPAIQINVARKQVNVSG